MPIHYITNKAEDFPSPEKADANGIVAIGGDMKPDRVLNAYKKGIFPWFSPWDPIMWWSPDPRFVLFPDELKVSKSMRPYFNQNKFKITFDTHFNEVVTACAKSNRKGEVGTWINKEIKTVFSEFHQSGLAHSIEVWENDKLVGGLYGLSLGSMFFGESMFSQVPNASKFGFITLVNWLKLKNFTLIDCQVHTDHLGSLGAKGIPRKKFLELLETGLQQPALQGKWEL